MAAATTNTDAATRRLLAAINERKPADEIKRMLDRMGQGSEERRKAVLNPKFETPLQAAHRLASHSVAAALLVAGASPSQLFNGEATALAICCAKGNADGVRALLVAGHDPAEKTTNFWRRSSEGYNGGLTAAHVCAVWSTGGKQVGQMECLRVLVEEGGADINAKNDGDETPIFWRMFVTSPKDPRASVDAFVSLGADLEARRRDGRTPLFVAAQTNHLKLVEAMLDAGASPDAKGKGRFHRSDGRDPIQQDARPQARDRGAAAPVLAQHVPRGRRQRRQRGRFHGGRQPRV
jgi:ankyrin repeat protein